jgi:uncharacterized protein (TIGR02118 family)
MIKLTFCLRRKPGLSLEEFQDYWLNKHGPLVRSFAKDLRILRYVQLHSLDDPMNKGMATSRNAPPAYDGVAQLWFQSMDSLKENARSPAARAANQSLLEDEAKFIDLENSPLWFGEEHVIVGD